jgi:hypothetical protein
VTKGNITGLAATAFVARLIVLLPVRTIGYRENGAVAERVSVNPPLMSKLFFIPERGNLRSWLPAIGPSRAPAAPQASAPSSVDLDAAVSQAISAASLGKWALFTAQSRLTTTLRGHIGGTFHFTPYKDRLQFPYANSETALTRGTVRKSLCARRNIG